MKINSIDELAALKGNHVWLITTFKHHNKQILEIIGKVHVAKWLVGEILNTKGQSYDPSLQGPWFCFEGSKTRIKMGKVCRLMFNVDDYINADNTISTTEKYAMHLCVQHKLTFMDAKIDFHPTEQYFLFEGTSNISMDDFLNGNIPTFGKAAWVI